tara:strand:+ start:795 stop:1517 length:723 start_codon:yes stop_codon:yes gene_type:complete
MTKKRLNQNSKYTQMLIESIEPDFIFNDKPINRFKIIENNNKNIFNNSKSNELLNLREKIYSIENCNLKDNTDKIIMGAGSINSPIMVIGGAPNEKDEENNLPFQGEAGTLLNKMFLAINIQIDKIYLSYSVNFKPPDERKPSSNEIKRYSIFLREHISIINPKILVLMGATAMEAVTGVNEKISDERGKWKEIIIKNKSLPTIITYSPSYLIRYPEYKKYSWQDLKIIKQKIQDLDIKI